MHFQMCYTVDGRESAILVDPRDSIEVTREFLYGAFGKAWCSGATGNRITFACLNGTWTYELDLKALNTHGRATMTLVEKLAA